MITSDVRGFLWWIAHLPMRYLNHLKSYFHVQGDDPFSWRVTDSKMRKAMTLLCPDYPAIIKHWEDGATQMRNAGLLLFAAEMSIVTIIVAIIVDLVVDTNTTMIIKFSLLGIALLFLLAHVVIMRREVVSTDRFDIMSDICRHDPTQPYGME